MNCYLHPENVAVAFCRSCGRPVCSLCQRSAEGTVFCPEHVPAAYTNPSAGYANPSDPYASHANPYAHPAALTPVQTSPGLAFLLGLIPGVGAIYNGQYLKGLVHAVVFGMVISLISSNESTAGQPLLGILAGAFYFYMPFEAYHTARKRQVGEPVEEWSSLVPQARFGSRAPVGPFILILLGVLFLLDSLHVIRFREIGRFWPVILIVYGVGMLYSRLSPPQISPPLPGPPPPSAPNTPDMHPNEVHSDPVGDKR